MWMRIAGALAVSALAFAMVTCGGDGATNAGNPPDTGGVPPNPTPSPSGTAPADSQSIACALNGASDFDSTCSVERSEIDGATLLAVFHPDGGFRRFEVMSDGSGLSAVAGADVVAQTLQGDILEIAIATNRYRFPADVR
ncbi:MAG: hypothetical protein CL808_03655 [Citromicrobium sp.]|nr:hypothetical protein [Citromicrobium sp.]